MIVHLFPKSQFAEEFIIFIRNNFSDQDHRIVLYTNQVFELPERIYDMGIVYDYDKHDAKWLLLLLKKAEGVVFHNLGIPAKELILIGICKPILFKSAWMIWGADLYCFREKPQSIGDYFVEFIRRRIAKNIKIAATIIPGDYKLLCEWYKCKAKNVLVEYCPEITARQMKRNSEVERKKGESTKLRIMVGNSASPTNNHTEVFELLRKYKNENIEVIVPLSYGDMKYAERVIQEGRDVLGDVFHPITDFMDRESYYDFLYTIDIGVFNNDRQQALANIEALIYYKRKVYIRNDTGMWNSFVVEGGYDLDSVDQIKNETFSEFSRFDGNKAERNYLKVHKLYDSVEAKEKWRRLFEELML